MSIGQYLRDTKNELRHVAWPTRTQTTVFTAFVIGLSLILALYLGLADLVFTRGVSLIVKQQIGTVQETSPIIIDQVATGTMPVVPTTTTTP